MATRDAPPHLFIIFGATGDLTRRKLLPSVYQLVREGRISGHYAILAIARDATTTSDETYWRWAADALEEAGFPQAEVAAWCKQRVHYQPIGEATPDDYRRLAERIAAVEEEHGTHGNRLFYLALPPSVFPGTIEQLGEAGLHQSHGWTRIVIEKPFGRDLGSSQALNELVHRYYDESQIFRIDHYLGKATVQNLLVLRFANLVIESIWNRDRVDSVEITVAESVGVERRGGYYDRAGALRDMIQNHVTQLLSLIAMEVPATFTADAVRSEKIKLLSAISPIRPEDVIFGQYAGGIVDDKKVPGYRQEERVAETSRTETYAALRLKIDNWRWQGVPFYLRTGKRMERRLSQVVVNFKSPPVCLFRSLGANEMRSNALVLTLQPDEGFVLYIEVKEPSSPLTTRSIPLHFHYSEMFGEIPDAYQTLLLDVAKGDQTLFVHAEEAEASWRLYTPILDWELRPYPYAAGSWGPREADRLLARDGRVWHNLGREVG